MRTFFLLAIVLSIVPGCTTRVGDLTIATSKNLNREFDVVQPDVEGQDCTNMIVFIPLGTLNPSMEGAIDDALESVPEADALVNARFRQSMLFTLIFNQSCVRVKGDAVRTASPAPAP